MESYSLLLQAHSGWRYVVMLTLVLAILMSIAGWLGNKPYTPGNRKINLFALISAHIQFLLGLILYFISPLVKAGDMAIAMKSDALRYWTVEHTTMMLIAIALITIGHSKSKRLIDSVAKHRTVAIFYTLAFIIIIAAIALSGRPIIGR
ncbi:MAG: cytochrome B [Sphingobacteriaceae bacterium]|nr:cytochrome B [Sphingobacteriaceae bacterium]